MNKGFDIVAPVYDKLASIVFGNALRKAQLSTISFIPRGAEVLIIGGGTGWYLQELLVMKRVKKIVYLEESQRMIGLAQIKAVPYLAANLDIVEFRLGTEESIQADERYDVVITHFILDLFPQLHVEQLIGVLKGTLREKGIWLFSDFVLEETKTGRWWKKLLLTSMYLFFQWCCKVEASKLPDFRQAFSKNDMVCIHASHFFYNLIASSVYNHQQSEKA